MILQRLNHSDFAPRIRILRRISFAKRVLFQNSSLGFCCMLMAVVQGLGLTPQNVSGQERVPSKEAARSLGFDDGALKAIAPLVEASLEKGQMAGAVVCIGRRDGVAYLKAFGNRQMEPAPLPMTVDTVFDLASLTKPLATGLSIMQLVDAGKVRLRDPARVYLPEFGRNGKEAVTILQLLTHQGGLIPDNALSDYQDGPDRAWQNIYDLSLSTPPGTQFKYTDVGFLVLGKVIEEVTGKRLNEYTQQNIYTPLRLTSTGFNPPKAIANKAAATEKRDGQWMVGEVHDPRAYLLEGVAGHAGLFSSAEDLSVLCRMMLNRGTWEGERILSPAAVRRMAAPELLPKDQIRGLGWDKLSVYSSNRGEYFSDEAFGHGGFTGTSLWVDPDLDLFVIFLSNRLHPDGKGSVNRLAGSIGTIAAASLEDPSANRHSDRNAPLNEGSPLGVKTGADVLVDSDFLQLAGKKVGLITNHTGKTSDGHSIVNQLVESPDVKLAAIFSPEHGFKGQLDQEKIDDQVDLESGVKIFSLYGKTRKPTEEMLRGLDVLVFDIQDIGTRFYTYVSTMGLAMEAASEHDLQFMVLDRPNPLGGTEVTGPVLDPGKESFVGFHPISVQHGMTVGELALMFREERQLPLNLEIIRCKNWERRSSQETTGLPWVSPSPNMRSFTAARLYPGIGLLEMTNLSVGRGTDTPFEWIGAPWIDGVALAKHLNQTSLSGIAFVPIRFVPNSSKYDGVECQGVNFVITDHEEFDSIKLGWTVATALRDLYPDHWEKKNYARLLGDTLVNDALRAGKSVEEIEAIYENELKEFLTRRQRHLLYGARK